MLMLDRPATTPSQEPQRYVPASDRYVTRDELQKAYMEYVRSRRAAIPKSKPS